MGLFGKESLEIGIELGKVAIAEVVLLGTIPFGEMFSPNGRKGATFVDIAVEIQLEFALLLHNGPVHERR